MGGGNGGSSVKNFDRENASMVSKTADMVNNNGPHSKDVSLNDRVKNINVKRNYSQAIKS